MIENIKTNQIVKFCLGDKRCTYKLSELFTTCVSCLPPSNRKILSIINTDTSDMSLFNHSKTVRAKGLKFCKNYHHTLCVMCPVSVVTYHMSLVTCHMSLFFLLCFLQRSEGSLLRVLLDFFLHVDTQYRPISARSGPFLIIRKSKLMRIEFYWHWNRLEVLEMTNFGGRRIGSCWIFSKARHWKVYFFL